jgi:hypothetical protein
MWVHILWEPQRPLERFLASRQAVVTLSANLPNPSDTEALMKSCIPMLVLFFGLMGVAGVSAETPEQYQPFLGRWHFESNAALRCPCVIDIRAVQANGNVDGSFYIADGQDVLTDAKITEGKNQRTLTVTLRSGSKGWLELSPDNKQLSGTWESKTRRIGGGTLSRMAAPSFKKIVQEQ